MAEEVPDLDTSRDEGENVGYREMGVDIGGADVGVAKVKQNPETASQLGTEETDGKSTSKRKKKAAQRIIQDGKSCRTLSGIYVPFVLFWAYSGKGLFRSQIAVFACFHQRPLAFGLKFIITTHWGHALMIKKKKILTSHDMTSRHNY